MKKLLGFQLADKYGRNIQGDHDDPTSLASFEVMDMGLAFFIIGRHPSYLLMPIFEGDIEKPSVVTLADKMIIRSV